MGWYMKKLLYKGINEKKRHQFQQKNDSGNELCNAQKFVHNEDNIVIIATTNDELRELTHTVPHGDQVHGGRLSRSP